MRRIKNLRRTNKVKLSIKIKVNELQEIKSVIEEIKKLELEKSPELNTKITIELGE